MDSETYPLDVLGQEPRINRLYTNLTFCLELRKDSSTLRSHITTILIRGLERLSADFPWTAGKVYRRDGRFAVRRSLEPNTLVVKDLTNDHAFPTWTTLKQANFPFSMLDEAAIAPCQTVANNDATTAELAVFSIQANFISDGLLLTFSGQHGAMDVTGLGQLAYLFSKACRSEPLNSLELKIGNINRSDVPLGDRQKHLDHANKQPDLNQRVAPTKKGERKGTSAPPTISWAYFVFSSSALASLKCRAMSNLIQGAFISTDDVLTALIWQSVSHARAPRLRNPHKLTSRLSRNVDMRSFLSLPATYPGLMTESTTHTSTIETLLKQTLGQIAVQLRSALHGPSLVRQLSLQASQIIHKGSASETNFAATSIPELDVRLSSWSKEKCYGLDFGFGKPQAVRRPAFTNSAREGLVYFLPKTLDDEIAVGMCLREDDLARLKDDADFARYGSHIG